jgi:hypothetical protein
VITESLVLGSRENIVLNASAEAGNVQYSELLQNKELPDTLIYKRRVGLPCSRDKHNVRAKTLLLVTPVELC